MPRSGPITMTFPPFAGATRKLVLVNVAVFFTLALLAWIAPGLGQLLTAGLALEPARFLTGMLWQPVTYAFVHMGITDILFGMLTLWFTGSLLEGAYGSRWLYELFFSSSIGGAVLASAITLTHVFGLDPRYPAVGAWAGVFGLLVAIGMIFGEQEFLLFFVLRLKAKYMVTIYILIAIAVLLKGGDKFGALATAFGRAVRVSVCAVRAYAGAWRLELRSGTSGCGTGTTGGSGGGRRGSSRCTCAGRTARSISIRTGGMSIRMTSAIRRTRAG